MRFPRFAAAATLIALAASISVPAQGADVLLHFVPLVGMEEVRLDLPIPRPRNRFVFGASISGGYPLLSLELEYLHGSSSDTFPEQSLVVSDSADRLKFGTRTEFRIGTQFAPILRLGFQGTSDSQSEVQNGFTTTTSSTIYFRPYVAAGLSFRVADKHAINTELTAVINDASDFTATEYQLTIGYQSRFP